ncbi:MAG: amidase [Alphaproteobacteria bacterium]|nr:amidase [Alphaproteobacteria bacterium]TAD88085.1 MAG: amidase [Alphaproteobacteria bacterium]
MADTIGAVVDDLLGGRHRAADLVDRSLARIADPLGQGKTTMLGVYEAAARAAAEAADQRRAVGVDPGPLGGVPITIKDLFDVAGEATRAGSVVLADAPPAARDAEIVARLRGAGAAIIGRTNMVEFAYSGIGWNPHYGTPLNPWDRDTGRVPGGSSSGAAVSVSDGFGLGAIGTDTGGSVRIPAALCGLVGFKPTARRVPRDGCLPLSTTLDSIGPIAWTVDCCARLDAVLAGERYYYPESIPTQGLRLVLPRTLVLEDLDADVAKAFEAALWRLSSHGVKVVEANVPLLGDLMAVNAKGGFAAAEAWHWHRPLMSYMPEKYDPRVRTRIERGATMTAADYLDAISLRTLVTERLWQTFGAFDAVVLPTTPIIAPSLASIATDDAEFLRANALLLRNTSVANLLDGCAISLPCHQPGAAPVGLSLMAAPMQDRRLLALAAALEPVIRRDIPPFAL